MAETSGPAPARAASWSMTSAWMIVESISNTKSCGAVPPIRPGRMKTFRSQLFDRVVQLAPLIARQFVVAVCLEGDRLARGVLLMHSRLRRTSLNARASSWTHSSAMLGVLGAVMTVTMYAAMGLVC